MGDANTLELIDETFRDGVQSRWGMMQGYHTSEPVIGEIGEVGYHRISIALHGAQPLVSARFMKEDPRILFRMWNEKLKETKAIVSSCGMGMSIDIAAPAENRTLVTMMYRQLREWMPNFSQLETICCTLDEIKNQYPILFPMLRSMGIEPIPYFAVGHGPQHNEEFYASRVKEVVEKYKPVSLCIKDVDGLLVADRLRTLITTFKNNASGTPIELHMHGMNGEQTYNAVVAMQMGIRRISTCIPPLAYGSSHPSVFNVIKNAEEMGIPHHMDVEKLKAISERLTRIGRAAGQSVDNEIMPFDLSFYKHQMPGGVISNTVTQLAQLGLSDKLQDVLEEIPRILHEMGHPIMITPFSQFITTQAVLNVQLGRWEQCIDSMVEFAAGIYGTEESGVAYMDENLKDKLLSLPQARRIQEKADKLIDYMNSEPTEEECYRRFGMSPSDGLEKFVLNYYLRGFDDAMKNVTPGGADSYRKFI